MLTRACWPDEKDPIAFRDRLRLAISALTCRDLAQGTKVKEFEMAWSRWLGSHHSCFVSSGSAAAFLLVSAVVERLDLRPGDKVLLSALGPISNVMPLLRYGLKPVFCDINLRDFSFDKASLAEIAKDHPDIRLALIHHPFGFPVSHLRIQNFLPHCAIIDDCSESMGAIDLSEQKVGSNSLGAIFSFGIGRHITTVLGGMISTTDSGLHGLILKKRAHGISLTEEASTLMHIVTEGYNFQNTNLLAVLGLSQIARLDKIIAMRKDHFATFTYIMDGHLDFFYPVSNHPGNSSFCLPIVCRDVLRKKKLVSLLKSKGIRFRPLSGNILRQPFLEKDSSRIIRTSAYSNANIVHDQGLCLANSDTLKLRHFNDLDEILLDMT